MALEQIASSLDPIQATPLTRLQMNRFFVLLLLSVSSTASAVIIRHDVDDSKYLVPATEFSSLVDMPGEGHGVLIAPQWIVTAAHTIPHGCVAEITLNGVAREVERVIIHPGYKALPQPLIEQALESGDASKVAQLLASSADIALIKLMEPVKDVAPATLYTGKDELGKIVKLVGKGGTGTGAEGIGPHSPHRTAVRRAFNTISSADERWLGYVFDKGPSAHTLEGRGGSGDSGGPVLIEVDGQWHLAGLTAWTQAEGDPKLVDLKTFRTGLYGQISYNVRLSSYAEWVDGVISADKRKASPGTSTIDQTTIDRTLQRLGSAFIAAGCADALSIALVKDGKVSFYNFGSTSPDRPQAPTERTVYEIGSVTKVFTSLLLAHAVTEGKVDLQDDIRIYLPGDYPKLSADGTPVRLIDLANTTSALPDNLPDFTKLIGHAGPDEAPQLVIDALRQYSNAQLLQDLKSAKLVDRPGAVSRHSNLASNLLAIILEKVYGESYENLLARYVEKPFGMASGTDHSRSTLFATGYNERKLAMPTIDARSILPAGGLRYSTSDMAKFLVAELAASDAAVRLSQKSAWGDSDHTGIGFNWVLNRSIDSKLRLRTSGGTFGQSSHIEMVPELGYGIVLLANRAGQTQSELQNLANKALEEIQGKPAVLSALEDALEKAAYRDVGAIIAKLRQVHPELHLSEAYVNQWAYRLLGTNNPKHALGLFQYNVERWPKSWNAFDSLAEAFERQGDTPRAIANYRRSLELNAGNHQAVERLKRLDPTSK